MAQADRIYKAVKKDILLCELWPGSVIAQPQLSARYQAGITPLREALQKLTNEGLIRPIPRFGYLVTPVTVTDVQELFEAREVLEVASARLAAVRASPRQLEALSKAAEFTYVFKDPATYAEFLEHNREFHLTVAASSGNCRLVEMLARVLDEMNRVFYLNLDVRDSAEQIRAEHQALVAALLRKDPDLCQQIISEQITQTRQRVLEALIWIVNTEGSRSLGNAVRLDPAGNNAGSPPCLKGVSNGSNQTVSVRNFEEEQ